MWSGPGSVPAGAGGHSPGGIPACVHGARDRWPQRAPGVWTLLSEWRTIGDSAVFHVDLGTQGWSETDALAWLDEGERERRCRFRHPGARRRFTVCRAAVRHLLCLRLGCRNRDLAFETSRHGKPHALVRGALAMVSFNVSHSGDHGLIAIASAGRIGVDAEERRPRRDLDRDIRSLFAPAERQELERLNGDDRLNLFYDLWTMKEALVKADGAGLALDTAQFEIPTAMVRGSRSAVLTIPARPLTWWRLERCGDARFAAAHAQEVAAAAPGSARTGLT